MYKHGIEVTELATRYEDPLATRFGVQVVVGTAPVFKVDDPDSAVNRAVRVSSMDEAEKYLGYSDEWEKFSLCASMKASFGLTNVYPVIFINVLDPAKHKKTNDLKEYPVTDHQITLEPSYVLKGSVAIKKKDSPETVYEADKDYILKYDDQDRLKAVFLSSGSGGCDRGRYHRRIRRGCRKGERPGGDPDDLSALWHCGGASSGSRLEHQGKCGGCAPGEMPQRQRRVPV